MPDPTPIAPDPSALQPAPPRRLALLGVGMGIMVVLVAFLVIKVVGGRKAPAKPVATEVAKAPEAAPAEPVAVIEPVPAPKAPAQPAAKATPAGPTKAELRAAKLAQERERAAAKRAAKVAEKRERAAAKVAEKRERAAAKVAEKRERASHQAKARPTKAPRATKVAMARTTAKASTPSAPAERADARPAYERGNAALLGGDGKGAIAAYREAVKSAPSDPIGFRGLGLAYEQAGETAAAIKALRRYLKLAPDAPDHAIISRRLDRLTARQTKHK